MANQKNYYYVLVFTDEGPVYVTSVHNASQTARWDKNETPKALPKYYAEDIVFGLTINYYQAVLVASHRQIDCQPYRYSHFDCQFVEKKVDEDD